MKNKYLERGKAITIVLLILLFTRLIPGIPWWSFVIPVFAFGVFIDHKEWNIPAFGIGFVAGSALWISASLYFHWVYDGNLLTKGNFIPFGITLFITGLTGGLLTGLALYAGKKLFVQKRDRFVLDIKAGRFLEKKNIPNKSSDK